MAQTESVKTIGISGVISASLRKELGDDFVAVALFGSRARGEEVEGSDWDVFVLARHLPERVLERAAFLKGMLPDSIRGEVSLLAKTTGEFEAGVSEVYLDVAVDGVILDDTDAYLAKRLDFLRTGIREKGLQREKDGRDLVWRYAPGKNLSLDWEGFA